jgi:hypothetical protein
MDAREVAKKKSTQANDTIDTDTEARKQEVEKSKKESKGKEWHADLASNSESIVR